jgi:3-oxoacyl-[acyl-carrier-protein] synthase-3
VNLGGFTLKQIGINSVGAALPERVLTNFDLEKMVDTTDEWIYTRTGIRERRILGEDQRLLDLLSLAGKSACAKAGLDSARLDFVINSTLTPDRISPAQACEVARELGALQSFCFDMNIACSGFIYGLALAESLLKTREIAYGLVSAGEQLSRLIDYQDRASCVLFGDAATAAVITNENPEHLLLYTELGSDPTLGDEVTIGGVKELTEDRKQDFFFRQNGKVVFKFAVNTVKRLFETVPEKVGLKPDQIKYVICHQANIRIIEAASKEITAAGKTEFLINLDKYGNTSSASIGLVLNENWDRFHKGDYILLIGFGGGLAWGAALIEW